MAFKHYSPRKADKVIDAVVTDADDDYIYVTGLGVTYSLRYWNIAAADSDIGTKVKLTVTYSALGAASAYVAAY